MPSDNNQTDNGPLPTANAESPHEIPSNKDTSMSMDELIYGASSFYAIVKPVSLTMLLSSLAVIYINTEESKAMGEAALGMYQAFDISDDASSATSLGLSLVNALIIVSVIGAMTFVIVLLYKFRCMKCLLGYMILATTVLLMFLGGNMFTVAINKYQLSIDKISYWFTMWNFAIVGTLAIFYQKGMPTVVNQGYLIANSTIVAWQLSYFNDWMAWSLLIMLALYDLFAVLSPCGPLKALVNLMSKKDAPAMPGLLYEAELPHNAKRPRNSNASPNATTSEREGGNTDRNNDIEENKEQLPDVDNNSAESIDADANCSEGDKGVVELTALHHEESSVEVSSTTALVNPANDVPSPSTITTPSTMKDTPNTPKKKHNKRSAETAADNVTLSRGPAEPDNQMESQNNGNMTSHNDTLVSAIVPLAIAKVYKLPISLPSTVVDASVDTSHPKAYLEQEFSPNELLMNVNVQFPRGGGRIETTTNKKNEPRYLVYDRNGELKRTLLVNEDGKVMEQRVRETEEKGSNNIKLGLGDFIFYSVLVSKAAENGFAAFVVCFLAILTGLGGTLVLLAVYHHALPALPISIFLAVGFYVLTIYCMEPWIQQMWQAPFYV
jgi:presenilin 1